MPPSDPIAGSSATPSSTGFRRFAETHDLQTLLILSVLMAFSSISTDIYLPALHGEGGRASARVPARWSGRSPGT